ncbi:group IID secretory phospholipase A2-like [Rhynchocyon petersi]
MIKQMTGKTPLFSYWHYGCHCGLGGKGQPKDATDWCCRMHDCCYTNLKSHKCHINLDNYKYNFYQGEIKCSDDGSWCEQHLCDCDKELASCLKRNLHTYNKHLRFYWRQVNCKGQTKKC